MKGKSKVIKNSYQDYTNNSLPATRKQLVKKSCDYPSHSIYMCRIYVCKTR